MHIKYLFIFIGFISFHGAMADVGRSCNLLFPGSLSDWTQLHDNYADRPLQELRSDHPGQWLEVEGHWMRYQLFGRKGPIIIHFEGLGGQLETTSHNLFLQEHLKKGRVLSIELEGQGLREVHARLQRQSQGLNPTREISFESNVSLLLKALPALFTQHQIDPKDISLWSGHSFGGLTLAALMEQGHQWQESPLIQLSATGVANFHHRLLSPSSKAQLSFYAQMFGWLPGAESLAIQNAMSRLKEDPLLSDFHSDPLKMESAISLTLGASSIDAIEFPSSYPPSSHLQIFSGENDLVLFNMLHWELADSAREAGHKVQMVFVEGVSHDLPKELSPSQVKAKLHLARNPQKYPHTYYRLTRRGQLVTLEPQQALELYQQSSRRTWEHQKDFLHEVFGALGQTPRYPPQWD
jgi:hypothetical protein